MSPLWLLMYGPLGLGVGVVTTFIPINRSGHVSLIGSDVTRASLIGSGRTGVSLIGSDKTEVIP